MIVIRGHKHLHECAYIGDDSSEEKDEILEAIADGTYVKPPPETSPNKTKTKAPPNAPTFMKRHRLDVKFHHSSHKTNENNTLAGELDLTDTTDPRQLKTILDKLYAKAKKYQGSNGEDDDEKDHVHTHRNSTIGKGEQGNFKIESSGPYGSRNAMTSKEVLEDVLGKLQRMGERGSVLLERIIEHFKLNKTKMDDGNENVMHNVKGRHYSKPPVRYDDNIDRARRSVDDSTSHFDMEAQLNENDEENDGAMEEVSHGWSLRTGSTS